MYAVLFVSNFYLQAVTRADPTLAKACPPHAADSRPSPSPTRHARTTGAQEELGLFENSTVHAEAAVNAASFQLPRGTGSARNGAAADPAFTPDSLAPMGRGSPEPFLHASTPPAVAIVSGDTKKSLVLQANSAALAAGVEIGMTAPQAQARCAQIILRQRSSSAEADAQSLVLICALDVAPQVENTSPGVCTIDVSGLPSDERSRHLARAVCHLREQGLHATGGIADTPLLALYAAHHTTSVRTVENAAAFLHPLPLAVASPTPEIAQVLSTWGITTLGQFTALPKQEVVRRLGTEGHSLWERARGGERRPLTPYAPAQRFFATLELEYEIETSEGVLFIIRRFVDRLALELRTAGLVAAELALTLKLSDESLHERSFRLPEPTAREDILFRTLSTYLESLRTDSAVMGVSLLVQPVRPLMRQPGLFETGLRDPHGFSETLARITAIVGSGQLGTPQLEDTYRPDAVKLVPPAPVVPAVDQPPVWPPIGLPLRRFRPPLPAHVELTSAGHPIFISGAQLHSPIAASRGPWRSSGDWWKPESWSREEWDVELSVGGVYRISKVQGEWYVDGEYE